MTARRDAEEWVPVGDLVPWADNPRINEASADNLVDVIREFGFLDPLIVRRGTGEVIAGHTRLKAAKRLGYDEVPVIWLDLDDHASKRLALIHNKAAERAEWDPLALAKLADDGLDLLTAGFSEVEVDELLDGLEFDDDPAGDVAVEKAEKAPGLEKMKRRLSISLYLFVDDADELDDLIHATARPGESRAGTVIRALDELRKAGA